jgi:biopolymer transport protein ExbD
MQFSDRKRRGTPAVIIVSLIDVLIVVLIFLMVTTTFKQQAALKVVLPTSNQAQRAGGGNEDKVTVSISKTGVLSLDGIPVTFDKLEQRLKEKTAVRTNLTLVIRADTEAPWGQVVKVRDAASAANIKIVNASVDSEPSR